MTIRVGFLGAGLIGTWHAGNLRTADLDLAWTGVFDPDRARAERFSASFGAPVRPDEEAVLDGCDAVYVCTWTSEHRRLVEAAAARGLAIFCEKPLSVDLAGARAMAGAAAGAGVVNQVGLVLRSSPAFCWLHHLLRTQPGGRVMSVSLRDDQYIPIQGMYASTWRGDRVRAGAGVLLEHSIHDVDILELLVGPMVSVTARAANVHALDGIEDAVAACIAFEDGAVGTMISVWHDMLERLSHRRVEVFSERMWAALDGSDWLGPVRWTPTGEPEQSLGGDALAEKVYAEGVAVRSADAAFIRCVQERRPATPDFATALRAHVVVDAMYRSAAAGGDPVDVRDGLGLAG